MYSGVQYRSGKPWESCIVNRQCSLYDVRRFQTLVDSRHRHNVHISCDFCIRARLVCWYRFGNAVSNLCLFGLYTCHQTGRWDVQSERAENIREFDDFFQDFIEERRLRGSIEELQRIVLYGVFTRLQRGRDSSEIQSQVLIMI